MEYAALQVTSNFTFLKGGSHPEELVEHAAGLGYTAIAITDRNTLAGIVRAHVAAKALPIRFIPACRLDLQDGHSLLAFPTDQKAYSRLSALLTLGNLRTEKGECHLYKADVYAHKEGILFVAIPPDRLGRLFEYADDFKRDIKEYQSNFGDALYVAATRSFRGDDAKRFYQLSRLGVPLVATGDVYYHEAARRELQDVLTCIDEKCTIHTAGYRLHANAEHYLKPIKEQYRLFMDYPQAIRNTLAIAKACTFSLDSLKYIEPEEKIVDGLNPQQRLVKYTWEGAHRRYGAIVPEKIKKQLDFELAFIEKRKLAPYFLRIYKRCLKAQELNILYQGRGSAANSTVCFCLYITAVDPMKSRLLFSRFMSDAREEWPDIDVDFEHERREEIIQDIYREYGRSHAAIVSTVTQVHWKGAVRDVGKAMGLSVDAVDKLAKSSYEFTQEWLDGKAISSEGFDASDPHLLKVLELTQQYIGFPRQLGQHTGGFVITETPLSDICPILNARMENRTQLEWNKDDLEALGILKIDVLALGMLTMIRKAFDFVAQHYCRQLTLANVPQDDPKVYKMISKADTIGVFQIESRAQMSMLPRLRPDCFYDLVIEVAIVRPGPIQGDMVHPYLRRRNGKEAVEYPNQELKDILGRTMGVPLFQEQAMEIAIVAAGFTPGEADQLRRSMATFKANGKLFLYEKKLVEGMVARGYEEDFSRRVFKQLQGFEGYGFPESHAASFALLVYISSWLKCYYPDVFCAALLNSQPMGFYQPAQIISDAQSHQVEVRPVDINCSCWDNTLEPSNGPYHAVRLGFRQVKGLKEEEMQLLVAGRLRPYTAIPQLLQAGVPVAAIEKLADADAFRSIGLDRRQALWEVTALHDIPNGLFEGQPSESAAELPVKLPVMADSEHVIHDYSSMSLSLKAHPVSFIRRELYHNNILPTNELTLWPDGTIVKVAGLVLVRQRPGTASGICFITIEDEHGSANLVVFKKLFDKYRKEIVRSKLLMVEGKLQREGEVTHVVARQCYDLSYMLNSLDTSQSRADERGDTDFPVRRKKKAALKPVQAQIFPGGRNFK